MTGTSVSRESGEKLSDKTCWWMVVMEAKFQNSYYKTLEEKASNYRRDPQFILHQLKSWFHLSQLLSNWAIATLCQIFPDQKTTMAAHCFQHQICTHRTDVQRLPSTALILLLLLVFYCSVKTVHCLRPAGFPAVSWMGSVTVWLWASSYTIFTARNALTVSH